MLIHFASVVASLLWALGHAQSSPVDSNRPLIGDPYGRTPIHLAAWEGDDAKLKRLLDQGGDANIRSSAGESPLHWARNGHVIDTLLAHGADLERRGGALQGPLSSACLRMRPSAVRRFLELGCDPNEKDGLFGATPLIHATNSLVNETDPTRGDAERIAIIHLLRRAGADPAVANSSGDTPIAIAKRFEATAIVKALVEPLPDKRSD